MTRGEKSDILWQYRDAREFELRLREKYIQIQLDGRVPGLRQSDGMPHATGGCRDLSDYMEKLDCAEAILADKIREVKYLRSETIRAINTLEDKEQRRLLKNRYVLGMPWERVREQMRISQNRANYVRRLALDNLQETALRGLIFAITA